MAETVRGRFAPSPSGRMHLGNLFSALLAWLSVRARGGELVLRMEDLDPDRCKAEYIDMLIGDLRWLGLDWEEGYAAGGTHGPYLQSERTMRYAEAFQRLEAMELVYPSRRTRAERLAASAPHRTDSAELEQLRQPAWMLRVPDKEISFTDIHMGFCTENLARDCGDFIIRRSDGVYAYQLAVVVDDGAMAVSEVVRGRDLLSSTPRQLYLYDLLGLTPPVFCHVPLLLAADGRRLSKRERDLDMGALRARFSPEEVVGRLAFLAGLLDAPEPVAPQELVPLFSWEKVPRDDIFVPEALLRS